LAEYVADLSQKFIEFFLPGTEYKGLRTFVAGHHVTGIDSSSVLGVQTSQKFCYLIIGTQNNFHDTSLTLHCLFSRAQLVMIESVQRNALKAVRTGIFKVPVMTHL
jgi:hypothetical protein